MRSMTVSTANSTCSLIERIARSRRNFALVAGGCQMPIRLVTSVAIALIMAAPVYAQQSRTNEGRRTIETFDTLSQRIRPGQTVYISGAAPGETEGRLISVSDASVTLLVQGSKREFLKDDIRLVARRGDSLKNGALIGMAVVAAWGLIGALITEDVESPGRLYGEAPPALAVYGIVLGMGAGVGALVDAAVKGKTVVYRDTQRTISAQPMVLPGRLGLRVAVRF